MWITLEMYPSYPQVQGFIHNLLTGLLTGYAQVKNKQKEPPKPQPPPQRKKEKEGW